MLGQLRNEELHLTTFFHLDKKTNRMVSFYFTSFIQEMSAFRHLRILSCHLKDNGCNVCICCQDFMNKTFQLMHQPIGIVNITEFFF